MLAEHELPPGYLRRDGQWVCDCPFCGKVQHFEWNVENNVGYCFVCKKFCQTLEQLKWAFSGHLDKVQVRAKEIRHKEIDPLGQCCAWEHSKSRAWCQQKNFTELAVRECGITYSPERDELYIECESISRDLPRSTLYRPLSGNPKKQKWLHLSGTRAAFYGWGISRFYGSGERVLLCEGLSDLIATGLYQRGIAALGSDLNTSWFYWLSKNVSKVYFWFDADLAGEKAYEACEKMARYYALPYKSIRTSKDPKFFAPQIPQDKLFLDKLEALLCK